MKTSNPYANMYLVDVYANDFVPEGSMRGIYPVEVFSRTGWFRGIVYPVRKEHRNHQGTWYRSFALRPDRLFTG